MTVKLQNAKRQITQKSVPNSAICYTGVSFTLHDLRRTFITIAESIDISAYALKRLMNHKMTNDVTAGYIVSDVERLRKPMEQISIQLWRYFKVDEEKKVLQLPIHKNA